MEFDNSLPFLIAQISTTYKVVMEKLMSEIDLHGGQVFILVELWKQDGLSQIELAAKLQVSAPTVNKMIKSLVRNGYLNCQKCGRDGRLMRAFLSSKGRDIRPQVEEQWRKIEDQIFQNLTETEKLVLFQLFGKLKENLSPK